MLTLRRYLSLCALLFWQGGFLFYAVIVVPVAGRVLEGKLHLRARITGEATNWLNGIGVVALALLLWDLASSVDPSRLRNRARGASWAVLFFTLAGLFALHFWMDRLDPPESGGPSEPGVFAVAHTLYLAAALVQSVAALVSLALAVSAWRAEDTKRAAANDFKEGKEREERKG